ncbi:hypothetical protein SynBIOSE41_02872 [Synechococcus sp. BIOS-E4-1]|nr:hypothetical protein SynBIOSE41_02872 [Synechococcus sp. BIOS-E4-1]
MPNKNCARFDELSSAKRRDQLTVGVGFCSFQITMAEGHHPR